MWTKFKAWYKAQGAKSKADHEARETVYHMEWVKKNVPYVTHEISQNIVFQLWRSGVKFDKINLWLDWLGKKPILWYTVLDKETLRYSTTEPTKEQQEEARARGGQIVFIR